MLRHCLLLLSLLALVGPVRAADPTPPTVSTADLQHLADSLSDAKQRDQFLTELKALIAARQATQPKPAEATPPTVIGEAQQSVAAMTAEAGQGFALLRDLSGLARTIKARIDDPERRDRAFRLIAEVAAVLAAALLVELILRFALNRGHRHRDDPAIRRGMTGIVFVVLRLGIAVLPVVVFAAVALALLGLIGDNAAVRAMASDWVTANVLARLIGTLALVAFVPAPPVAAPFALPEAEGRRLVRQIAWLAGVGCYGWAVAQTAWWLGLPPEICSLLLRLVALAFTITGIWLVLASKDRVARMIAGRPVPADAPPSSLRALRQRFASIWHVFAVIYLIGAFAVFMVRLHGGFLFVLRATVLTLVIAGVARLLVNAFESRALGLLTRDPNPERPDFLRGRARHYAGFVGGFVRVAVWLAGVLLILTAWGVRVGPWLSGGLGATLMATTLRLVLILLIAVILWETASMAIERSLAADPSGGSARASRVRTLLPLLRNALFVTLVVMVGLVAMSQLGLNIAPLLAGAGVVGVAVGFGSQALVKDVITGLFMLIENTVAVGDRVNLGNNQMGVFQLGLVEGISIRTLRLRDEDGALHTVPFSQVNAVINYSRDFAYCPIVLTLAADQDPAAATRVLEETSQALRADPDIGPAILGAIEVDGVDTVAAASYTLKARLKTRPLSQPVVARAFNALLRDRLRGAEIKLA